MEGNNKIQKDEAKLKEHITSYYQNLFGPPEKNNFTILESRVDDIPQVSDLENNILIAEFSETEVKKRPFSAWNIIRLQAQMVFLLNFAKFSRKS